MTQCAFLFPGQGSQQVGMGKLLAEAYPRAAATFEEADRTLGFSLSSLCFEGPEDALRQTVNTQPALLTVSTAAYRVLHDKGYRPSVVAGHSLGEYSAMVAAGGLDFCDALRLVRKRGQYMQEAVPEGVGAMAALLKLPAGKLDAILEAACGNGEIVSAANYNSPDQVVIAGNAQAVSRAMQLAKDAGAKRAIPLPVSAPFHCILMKPAQERLAVDLDQTRFYDLETPLINNWQAHEVQTSQQARAGLFEQIPNPVLWTQSIEALRSRGITHFVEVGSGAVLTGLCKNIDASLSGAKFSEPADLEKVEALFNQYTERAMSTKSANNP